MDVSLFINFLRIFIFINMLLGLIHLRWRYISRLRRITWLTLWYLWIFLCILIISTSRYVNGVELVKRIRSPLNIALAFLMLFIIWGCIRSILLSRSAKTNGEVAMQKGDYKKAASEYWWASRLNPTDADARYKLSYLYCLLNRFEEAKDEFDKYFISFPTSHNRQEAVAQFISLLICQMLLHRLDKALQEAYGFEPSEDHKTNRFTLLYNDHKFVFRVFSRDNNIYYLEIKGCVVREGDRGGAKQEERKKQFQSIMQGLKMTTLDYHLESGYLRKEIELGEMVAKGTPAPLIEKKLDDIWEAFKRFEKIVGAESEEEIRAVLN